MTFRIVKAYLLQRWEKSRSFRS